MSEITDGNYQAMLTGVARLFECPRLSEFPERALTEILALVRADRSTFNHVAPGVPRVVAVAKPLIPDEPVRTRRFGQYLPQHAVLSHFLATGDPGTFKLSDFQTEREYHALPLDQEFYRELEYEDQLTFMRGSERSVVLSLETVPGKALRGAVTGLTKREIEVLLEVEKGKTNGEVSAALGIGPLTVRVHLEHIFAKLKAPNRTAAVVALRRLGAGRSD